MPWYSDADGARELLARLDDLERRLAAAADRPSPSRCWQGDVVNRGKMPTATPGVYLVRPADLSFPEGEGGPASYGDPGPDVPVLVLGDPPSAGDRLVVFPIEGGKWAARANGAGGGVLGSLVLTVRVFGCCASGLTGACVAGATVTLYDAGGAKVGECVTPPGTCACTFDRLPRGTYTLTVSHPLYQGYTATFLVSASGTRLVNLSPAAGKGCGMCGATPTPFCEVGQLVDAKGNAISMSGVSNPDGTYLYTGSKSYSVDDGYFGDPCVAWDGDLAAYSSRWNGMRLDGQDPIGSGTVVVNYTVAGACGNSPSLSGTYPVWYTGVFGCSRAGCGVRGDGGVWHGDAFIPVPTFVDESGRACWDCPPITSEPAGYRMGCRANSFPPYDVAGYAGIGLPEMVSLDCTAGRATWLVNDCTRPGLGDFCLPSLVRFLGGTGYYSFTTC